MIRELLKHGAAVDLATDAGSTPIGIAANLGHSNVVRELMEAKADVGRTCNGRTPLQLAKSSGKYEAVRILQGRGPTKASRRLPPPPPLPPPTSPTTSALSSARAPVIARRCRELRTREREQEAEISQLKREIALQKSANANPLAAEAVKSLSAEAAAERAAVAAEKADAQLRVDGRRRSRDAALGDRAEKVASAEVLEQARARRERLKEKAKGEEERAHAQAARSSPTLSRRTRRTRRSRPLRAS